MRTLSSGYQRFEYEGGSGPCAAIVDIPAIALREPTPLILAPHPAGWTADEDFHGGAFDTVAPHPGWYGVAERYGVTVVAPVTYGANVPLLSLGYGPSLDDTVRAIEALRAAGVHVDEERAYACGLSMGGQETLLLIARNPGLFAAGFAFNPVIDVQAWYDDFAASPYYPELAGDDPALALDALIRAELGGPPSDHLAASRERSPISFPEMLTKTPLMLYWSHLDDIVPHQATRQTKRMYDEIKRLDPTAPVAEYNHTWSHGYSLFDVRERWALHEYSDYDLAARWLLTHKRGPIVTARASR